VVFGLLAASRESLAVVFAASALRIPCVMTRSLCQDLPKHKSNPKEQSGIPPIGHFAEVSLAESLLIFSDSQHSKVLSTPWVRSLR
jgi:hypothetical protein